MFLKNPYNIAARKIVRLGELEAKINQQCKTDLSPLAMAYLNLIINPINTIQRIYYETKQSFTGHLPLGILWDPKDQERYITGELFLARMPEARDIIIGKKLQLRLNRATARAFNKCDDANSKPVIKRLQQFPKFK